MKHSEEITWQTTRNLWRDRFARRDVYRAFGFALLPLLIVYFMIVFEGETVDPVSAAGWLGLLALVFVIIAFIAGRVIIPKRARMRFVLTAEAASMEMTILPDDDQDASSISRGVAPERGEPFKTTTIPWKNITAFQEHPTLRVISLHNEWRTLLRLYCTNDTQYQQALNLVRLYIPQVR